MQISNLVWLRNLSRLGVKNLQKNDVSRRIIFSNVVFVSLPIVYLIFILIDYQVYIKPIQALNFDQLIVPIVIGFCFAGLWLNKQGYTLLSRIAFVIIWPLLMHIIPLYLLKTPSDYYIAYPFGLVFHSILIQLMFSHRFEFLFFWSFGLFNFVAIIFTPQTLGYFASPENTLEVFLKDKYYFYVIVLYWLLFNLLMFYILHVIEIYIRQINESKEMIELQKEELNTVNHNLEMIVAERTQELETQNQKLIQHAHYNAHLLRGPFCRVKGLLLLDELYTLQTAEAQVLKEKLWESLNELDERIREIQAIVELENLDD